MVLLSDVVIDLYVLNKVSFLVANVVTGLYLTVPPAETIQYQNLEIDSKTTKQYSYVLAMYSSITWQA